LKTGADAAFLQGVAEFHLGLADLEALDISSLVSKGGERDPEVKRAQDANQHFKNAQQFFQNAANDCLQFKDKSGSDKEGQRLIEQDIRVLKNLATLTGTVVTQLDARSLPSQDSIYSVTNKFHEMMGWAMYRAQAHKGTDGHLPDQVVKF
jgi:hypothetical protein